MVALGHHYTNQNYKSFYREHHFCFDTCEMFVDKHYFEVDDDGYKKYLFLFSMKKVLFYGVFAKYDGIFERGLHFQALLLVAELYILTFFRYIYVIYFIIVYHLFAIIKNGIYFIILDSVFYRY